MATRARRMEIIFIGDEKDATRAAGAVEKSLGGLGDKLRVVTSEAEDGGRRAGDGMEGLEGKILGLGTVASAAGNLIAGGIETAISGIAAVGQKIGETFVGAFSDAIDVEMGEDRLATQLALDPEESRIAGDVAGGLYADAYGESLGEVNEALRRTMQLIPGMRDVANPALEEISAHVLDVGTAFDQDLAQVARTVGTLMRNGMAPDAEAALDLITVGLQGPANAADDLLETLTEYPTLFRNLGLDGPMAMGLISQAMDAGARDSDKAADALKEFSIRAIDGSDLTAEGFASLGLSASAMADDVAAGGDRSTAALDETLDRLRAIEDPVERSRIAVALFGTQAEDLGDALYAMDPSSAVGFFGEVEGAADRAGQTLNDNTGTRIEAFKRQIQTAFSDAAGFILGEAEPALTAFFDTWGTGIEQIKGGDLAGGMETIFGGLDELGAGLAEAWNQDIWPVLEPALDALMERFGVWWDETGSPWVKDMLGAALEAAWDGAWSWIGDRLSDPGWWLDMLILSWAGPLAVLIGDEGPRLLESLWNSMWAWVTETGLPWLGDIFGGLAGAAVEWIWNVTTVMPRLLWHLGGIIVSWITDTAWPWIKDSAGSLAEAITSWIFTAVTFIPTRLGMVAGAIWSWISNTASSIWDRAGGMWEGLVGTLRNAVNSLISIWNSLDLAINWDLPRIPDWVPVIGGRTFGIHVDDIIPDVPYLAAGGRTIAPGLAVVGELGPEVVRLGGGAEVVPLNGDRLHGGGGVVVEAGAIVIHADSTTNGRRVARDIIAELEEYLRRGGTLGPATRRTIARLAG